jgi:hypothetical protein
VQKLVRTLVWLVGLSAATAMAGEYSEGWGPAVGSPLPVLEANDQAGQPRTLDNLAGEQGLLLFLNRSADW